MKRILLLEDDLSLGETIKELLLENDYEVDYVTKGNDVIEITFDKEYDLYIFDINVPDIDGLEILKSLRDADDSTPAIFISAKTDLKTFLKGFEVGADDFIKKPFYPEELIVKVNLKLSSNKKEIAFNDIVYLPKNKQSHLYIEYNRGLQKVLQRIRAKYPELVMQLCAGGGARVNYGLLPYFDEFWTSDDTDALQRIYMQWGVSGFFPAIAMASHVSADKNHQTGRRIPLKFRFDVAMSGRLGMEIQPKDMNDVDKAFAKRAIAAYKDIRPVVQFGDLYRLVSPYDNKGVSSLMYVTSEKNKAVFYAYKISHFINMVIPKVCMNGLDPSKNYRLVDLTPVDSSKPCDLNGKIISGKILMEEGIALKSLLKSEYSSLALQLQAVD